jgi:hypothetical protein
MLLGSDIDEHRRLLLDKSIRLVTIRGHFAATTTTVVACVERWGTLAGAKLKLQPGRHHDPHGYWRLSLQTFGTTGTLPDREVCRGVSSITSEIVRFRLIHAGLNYSLPGY